jgi:hypothetical protein
MRSLFPCLSAWFLKNGAKITDKSLFKAQTLHDASRTMIDDIHLARHSAIFQHAPIYLLHS